MDPLTPSFLPFASALISVWAAELKTWAMHKAVTHTLYDIHTASVELGDTQKNLLHAQPSINFKTIQN